MQNSLNIIFAGTPEFAVPSLAAIQQSSHRIMAVYTQPDAPAGRGRKLAASPVKEYALAYNIPVLQPTSLRQIDVQQTLADFKADLMVVIAYGQILPEAVLQAFRFGCINVHASLLPAWRGAAPIQRAILAGDNKTGVTIMQMERGLDTGPILHQVSCAINETETGGSLHERLAHIGSAALMTVLNDLSYFIASAQPQVHQYATYAHKLTKQEGRLNWQASAEILERQIRAFDPWPGSFCFLGEELIRVHAASVVSDTDAVSQQGSFLPGTMININKEGIDVLTGQGVLRLIKLQFAGGKPVLVKDILNAKPSFFKKNEQLI